MTSELKKALLWCLSGLIVIGLHLALFYWSSYWKTNPPVVQAAPAAMIIQLAPAAATPKPAPPPPPVEPEPEPEQPKVVEAPKPRIEIAKPKPRPRPRPPRPEPPRPPVEQPKPSEPSETVAESSEPAPVGKPSETSAAPVRAPSGPSAAEVSWQSQLLAHLARYRQYPHQARSRNLQGTVSVRFTVDANGRVLNYDFVQSSGHAILDRATRQMISRAQPLPRPPATLLSNGSIEVIAPIVYNLTR